MRNFESHAFKIYVTEDMEKLNFILIQTKNRILYFHSHKRKYKELIMNELD